MKIIKLSMLAMLLAVASYGQNTNYGTSSGTGGSASSFFGYFSGNVVSGANNSYFGSSAGRLTTSGAGNTAIGASSLYNNITGGSNTAVGAGTLTLNTASNNTAIGSSSLAANTTGSFNTGTGGGTLNKNTTGNENTAFGYRALYNNVAGVNNSAVGAFALFNNNANGNVAMGHQTLISNTTGTMNTAVGTSALLSHITGSGNTAVGTNAMNVGASGTDNSAFGTSSLNLTTGTGNTAAGSLSVSTTTTGSYNTGLGYIALNSNTTGTYNSALGAYAGPNAGNLVNSTAIGANTATTASQQVRIGSATVNSIGGPVDFSVVSDRRFKLNIKEDVSGLDLINKLRPVSYNLDRRAISKFLGTPDSVMQQQEFKSERQTGFIAQEVEKTIAESGFVFHAVEAPQNDNDHYSIRYAQFVVPLVKAVQELSAKVELQEKRIEALLNQLNNKGDSLGAVLEGQARLFQNAPNPFSTETEIKMSIPETAGNAYIVIYNLEGKELKSTKVLTRGKEIKVNITAGEFNAGMYLYVLLVEGKVVDTKRMILTR